MRKTLSCGCATLAVLLVSAAPAAASPLSILIGSFSFDTFIADDPLGAGINAFNINNFTGPSFVDGNAATPLLFSDLSVRLTDEAFTETLISLSTFSPAGPGPLLDGGSPLAALQFPTTTLFRSARLEGSVSPGVFLLPGGDVFTAASLLINVLLLPSSGDFLTADADLALISLDGETSPQATVPEPASLVLLGGGLSLLGLFGRRRRHLPDRQ